MKKFLVRMVTLNTITKIEVIEAENIRGALFKCYEENFHPDPTTKITIEEIYGT